MRIQSGATALEKRSMGSKKNPSKDFEEEKFAAIGSRMVEVSLVSELETRKNSNTR
jgi:hypothetical protein